MHFWASCDGVDVFQFSMPLSTHESFVRLRQTPCPFALICERLGCGVCWGRGTMCWRACAFMWLRCVLRHRYSLTSSYQSQFGAEEGNNENDSSAADGTAANQVLAVVSSHGNPFAMYQASVYPRPACAGMVAHVHADNCGRTRFAAWIKFP